MQKLLITAGTLLSILSASAQEKEATLDPVTVTASIIKSRSTNTGRNIIAIKGETIAKLPVNSLDELLRYLPGLEVQQRGPMGVQSDFVIRGGTFQQVLVIIDGLRLNDPNTGHFNGNIPIAPSEIESIEVLKGASSALYGSDAVGGVVQIITKSFASRQKAKKQLDASVATGEYGLLNASAGGFYSDGKTAVNAAFLSNNADGQQQRGTRGFFNLNTFSLSASHQLNQYWQLALRSSYDTRKFAAQNFYTTFLSDTADEKLVSSWNQLRLSYEKDKNKFSIHGGYKTVEDTYQYNNASVANSSRSNLWQVLSVFEHEYTERTSFSTGVQLQSRNISSNDRGEHTLKQAAAFVVLNQKIGNAFHIHPALRLDWDEKRGWELIPQFNAAYRFEKVVLRASAGKTIRDADFTERYNNYNKALVSSGRIGNPDLTAERSFSYEAGVDFFPKEYLKISAGAFVRDHSDLVDWTNTPYAQMPRKDNLAPNGTYALAKNIASVKTEGVETDVQFTKNISQKQHLLATAGLVWLYTKSSDATPSFYISSHAKMLTNFSVVYNYGRYAIALNGVYKSRANQAAGSMPVAISKDYFLMNAKFEVSFLEEKLKAFVQGNNIFDRRYSDLLGSVMPGRWMMGGLRFSITKQ